MKYIKKFTAKNESDNELSLSSYHMKKLNYFTDRLNNITTAEDCKQLISEINEYEESHNLEEIEGPWGDLVIMSNRKLQEFEGDDEDDDEGDDIEKLLKKLGINKNDIDNIRKNM